MFMQNSFIKYRCDENDPKWEQAIKREIPLYGRNNEIRSDFERDYTRLLHSDAFRRLKHKTQVFYAPHNDHICTRMEHVMHVSSVAATIAELLQNILDLTTSWLLQLQWATILDTLLLVITEKIV